MLGAIRSRLTYANVMATIAVFIALGGSALAVSIGKDDVDSREIAKEAVRSSELKNDGIKGKDIRTDAITGENVLESTLGPIPRAADADTLDGRNSSSFLGVNGKAADADTLDGQDSSAFLGVNGKAADSNPLDGQDSSAFLGSTAKAADAQLLDGVESDDFVRVSGLVNGSTGSPLSTGITSVRNAAGDYTVTINDGTFPNSGTSCSLLRPVVSPVGNEFHVAVWNEAGCSIGGGAEFDVLTFDEAGAAEDATFGFIVDVVP